MNGEGNFFGADLICLHDEQNVEIMYHPVDPDKSLSLKGLKTEPLLHHVMQNGQVLHPLPSLKEISDYRMARLSRLAPEHKRFENPHIYKVGISSRLMELRNELKQQHK